MKSSRLEELARELAVRDRDRAAPRARARELAERLHGEILAGLDHFRRTLEQEGAPHLDLVRVSPVEPDDKSVRAFQIRISRGRYHALVVSKDRGEVMLVGPFRQGSSEEPCNAIHLDEEGADKALLDAPLEDLLVSLIRESCRK